jgi:serine/threonine protein kinase
MNVVDTKKVSYNVLKKLGEGSQGVTYLLEDKRHIVKLFNKHFDSNMSKSKINFLINLNLDKKIFAIPLRAIAQPSNGYIAEFASGMIPLSEMKLNPKIESLSQWYKETGGLIRRYKLLIHLSSILRTIHSKGLTYCDLSPNNIFISENTEYHNVFLIDLDNLRYKTSLLNNIFTPFYGAPELVNNTAPNTPMSDSFSFAVIAYEILALNHPLIGDYVSEGEPEFEGKALAGKLPWVEHSTDTINHRSTGFPSDKVIPKKLMKIFDKTFDMGLNDAMKRPSMAEWFDGLNLALNELLKCGNKECGLYYPYNNYNSCTFCGHKPKVVTRIQMRRWEEIESYIKKTNQIESNFLLEPTIYEEILIDENTEKDVAAFNFLIGNKEPLQSILNIQHINEKGENKLLLTPLNSMAFQVSPRTGISDGGKSIKLDTPKKIRVIDKTQSDKQKYMLHLQDLNTPQRVLTID